jgi:hypothetical protein
VSKPISGYPAGAPAQASDLFLVARAGANDNLLMSDVGAFPCNKVFPATQVPSADPNTLDDYEEGTWTPTDASGASLIFTSVGGKYVKVGSLVFALGTFVYPGTASGANATIGGFPFTCANDQQSRAGGSVGYTTAPTFVHFIIGAASNVGQPVTSAGVNIANATLSATQHFISVTYPV